MRFVYCLHRWGRKPRTRFTGSSRPVTLEASCKREETSERGKWKRTMIIKIVVLVLLDNMPSDFGPPFADSDADLILRSSDNVDFRVHKLILAKASEFFRDFPYEVSPTDGSGDCPPVVPLLNERHWTVERLLRFIYPVDPPCFSTLPEVRAVLEAGHKYQVDAVAKRIADVLLRPRFVEEQPLAVYALSCGYRVEPSARAAARNAIGRDLLTEPGREELRYMSGEDYHRLLEYLEKCTAVVRQVTSIEKSTRSFSCTRIGCG